MRLRVSDTQKTTYALPIAKVAHINHTNPNANHVLPRSLFRNTRITTAEKLATADDVRKGTAPRIGVKGSAAIIPRKRNAGTLFLSDLDC